jgi:hypothetical protein
LDAQVAVQIKISADFSILFSNGCSNSNLVQTTEKNDIREYLKKE